MSEQSAVVPGMDLRDYIAVQVLAARVSRDEKLLGTADLCQWAYEVANGMMAYRRVFPEPEPAPHAKAAQPSEERTQVVKSPTRKDGPPKR